MPNSRFPLPRRCNLALRRLVGITSLAVATLLPATWSRLAAQDDVAAPVSSEVEPAPADPAKPPQVPLADAAPSDQPPTIRQIVFFGDPHPIFVQLELRIEAQPLDSVWENQVRQTFAFLDRDGDERLDSTEFGRMQWDSEGSSATQPQFFKLLLSGLAGSAGEPPSAEMTLERFRDKYRRHYVPFSIRSRNPEVSAGERVFARLDLNEDNAISTEEFQARFRSLTKLDGNDDETISRFELAQFVNPFSQEGQMQEVATTGSPDFLFLDEEHMHETIAYRVLTTYSPQGGLRSVPVTAQDLGLPSAAVARFDRNEDGGLDREELQALFRDPPRQIELLMSLSPGDLAETWKASAPSPSPQPAAVPANSEHNRIELQYLCDDLKSRTHVTVNTPQQLVLLIDQQQFEFGLSAGSQQSYAQFFTAQFSAADSDNNGYLEADEFENRQQLFGTTFDILDQNGDGMVFPEEMLEHFHRQLSHYLNRTEWNVVARGRRLFQLLDQDANGALTQRELKVPFDRLLTWDGRQEQPADGVLQAEEIPRCFTITLATAQPERVGGVFFGNQQVTTYRAQAPGQDVPGWFQKLDRNSDGDVSAREFPGPVEIFEKLDRDGNGLLDPSEAQ